MYSMSNDKENVNPFRFEHLNVIVQKVKIHHSTCMTPCPGLIMYWMNSIHCHMFCKKKAQPCKTHRNILYLFHYQNNKMSENAALQTLHHHLVFISASHPLGSATTCCDLMFCCQTLVNLSSILREEDWKVTSLATFWCLSSSHAGTDSCDYQIQELGTSRQNKFSSKLKSFIRNQTM